MYTYLVKIFSTAMTELTIPTKINMGEEAPKQMPVCLSSVLYYQLQKHRYSYANILNMNQLIFILFILCCILQSYLQLLSKRFNQSMDINIRTVS